jgi:hypothetical protein
MAEQDADSWTFGRRFSWKKLALALVSEVDPAARWSCRICWKGSGGRLQLEV